MNSRIGLKTSSNQILRTLEKISQLQSRTIHDATKATTTNNNNDHDNNDDNEDTLFQQKQNQLSLIIKSSFQNKKIQDHNNNNNEEEVEEVECYYYWIPLSAISIAKYILQHCHHPQNEEQQQLLLNTLENELELNLKETTKLSIISSSSSSSGSNNNSQQKSQEEKIQYEKRIQKLKLGIEERNYSKLTSNIESKKNDDAALSSMLYASSVGMNMIVAPISIGVLMYFFAGKLMVWIFANDSVDSNRKEGKLNIHGVIVGVISGVIMLFIEMILFVIRNHEMDRVLSDKKKKSKKNAFGYDPKHAQRTFHG